MSFRETFLLEASFALEELSRRGGYLVTAADRALLGRSIRGLAITWKGGIKYSPTGEVSFSDGMASPDLTDKETASLTRVINAAFTGFFDAAADGLPLTALSTVAEWLGKPVHRAYPVAGPEFVKMATTYWTMKTLVRNGYTPDQLAVAVAILDRLERQIGLLFFPTNAEFMAASQRELQQRKVLGTFARRIDMEEFMSGNPLLG